VGEGLGARSVFFSSSLGSNRSVPTIFVSGQFSGRWDWSPRLVGIFQKKLCGFESLMGWSFGGCGLLKQKILVVIGCGSLAKFLFRF